MSNNQSVNNRRLVKNTALLYVRMIFVLLISLYLVRFLLKYLGIVDYGIFNVITSISLFMGIVSSSMTSAAQRYFAYALGNEDVELYKDSFTILTFTFLFLAILGFLLLKYAGIWFINNQMVIPADRVSSAIALLHLTIVTFCISTITIPFQSSVISHEKMDIYAYVSIAEICLKLFVVYTLRFVDTDKLIWVGGCYLVISILVAITYIVYCFVNISGCRFSNCRNNRQLSKSLFSYMGWNLFGTTTATLNVQGQALLLNVFYGPVINAAKGVADQVNSAISSFVTNFYMALNPQIIKTYARGDLLYARQLLTRSSKYSVYLLEVLALPIIFNMKGVLELWLGKNEVSNEMIIFCQLILMVAFTNALEGPLTQVVRATGDIKNYQIKVGIQTLLFLPICYVLFRLGVPAYFSLIVLLIINIIVLFTRVRIVMDILYMERYEYVKVVISPSLFSVLICGVFLYIYKYVVEGSLIDSTIINVVANACIILIFLLLVGLSKDERCFMFNSIKQYVKKRRQNSR